MRPPEWPPDSSNVTRARYIKGKSAIHIARNYAGKKRNYNGEQFWARGYFVSTVGKDEQKIKEYVLRQQAEDRKIDQLRLG
ncbi:MAG: transposase [Armatimonadetes bacterium]|nr:transposase [Armatimonadota bacterium]